jgi:hypothetical protein
MLFRVQIDHPLAGSQPVKSGFEMLRYLYICSRLETAPRRILNATWIENGILILMKRSVVFVFFF